MTDLITLIDAEIARLQQARAAITATDPATGKKKPGRPAKATKSPSPIQKKKRRLSPEGRARIVAAVKAHWAAKKKATTK